MTVQNSKRKEEARLKRHRRIRKRLLGTKERPRLCVHRSHLNFYAQAIDDIKGNTLCAVSTLDKAFRDKMKQSQATKVKVAELLGEFMAKALSEKGVNRIVFDRGGYLYHGRVKAFADAVRKNGITF